MTSSSAAQLTLDTFDLYLDAVEAHAPKHPPMLASAMETLLNDQDGQMPPTQAQVYYWRELAGAMTLRGTAGMPDDGWPVELAPSQATLKQLVERRLIVRRGRAWHLRRDWYTRLAALRQIAVETPTLAPVERPAPDLPTYAELKAFETICCYLDTQPKSRARLPFTCLALDDNGGNADEAPSGTSDATKGQEDALPVSLLRLMRRYRLVRHTASCEWALSPTWQDRLKLLWRGMNTALRDYTPPQLAPVFPRSLVAGIDTWHLNWLVEHPLPSSLRERLDHWQDQAREEETELETDLYYDDAPLVMYRWGTKAERGKGSKAGAGVSWGYVLLNKSLRLLIRKSPLGGIMAQARLGSECLWRRTPKAALDELTLLMKRLWVGQHGRWQVSQVHLCHDVANVPLDLDLLSRFVSRSRQQAVYEAAQAEMQRITRVRYGNDLAAEDLLLGTVDWDAEFVDDDPMSAFSSFAYGDVFAEDGEGTGWGSAAAGEIFAAASQVEQPLEERASAIYRYGKRLSGLTFSPGGAISFAIYLKRLESLLRRKVHMFPLWKAAGWNEQDEVTRFEARLRRDALRELRLRLPGVEQATLDDPYELLKHLEAVFGLVVGRRDDCPEAVNTAWIRLVVPREGESNRSRWDTDPAWRVVQAASFSHAPAPARRIIRRKQRAHNVQHLVAGSYGYLASFIAEQFPAGEQWDVSRAVRELADAWVDEAAKPGKDFGEVVRQRRKERGLAVLSREEVLSALPLQQRQERMEDPYRSSKLEDKRLLWQEESTQSRSLMRLLSAEQRMRDALRAFEYAELRQAPEQALAELETCYEQELTTYTAIYQSILVNHTLAGQ